MPEEGQVQSRHRALGSLLMNMCALEYEHIYVNMSMNKCAQEYEQECTIIPSLFALHYLLSLVTKFRCLLLYIRTMPSMVVSLLLYI